MNSSQSGAGKGGRSWNADGSKNQEHVLQHILTPVERLPERPRARINTPPCPDHTHTHTGWMQILILFRHAKLFPELLIQLSCISLFVTVVKISHMTLRKLANILSWIRKWSQLATQVKNLFSQINAQKVFSHRLHSYISSIAQAI